MAEIDLKCGQAYRNYNSMLSITQNSLSCKVLNWFSKIKLGEYRYCFMTYSWNYAYVIVCELMIKLKGIKECTVFIKLTFSFLYWFPCLRTFLSLRSSFSYELRNYTMYVIGKSGTRVGGSKTFPRSWWFVLNTRPCFSNDWEAQRFESISTKEKKIKTHLDCIILTWFVSSACSD